jgi:hypothetical protein
VGCFNAFSCETGCTGDLDCQVQNPGIPARCMQQVECCADPTIRVCATCIPSPV